MVENHFTIYIAVVGGVEIHFKVSKHTLTTYAKWGRILSCYKITLPYSISYCIGWLAMHDSNESIALDTNCSCMLQAILTAHNTLCWVSFYSLHFFVKYRASTQPFCSLFPYFIFNETVLSFIIITLHVVPKTSIKTNTDIHDDLDPNLGQRDR